MKRRSAIPVAWLMLCLAAAAARAEPYGFDDIRLGASYASLARALDFRDIHGEIARQRERGTAAPDLGRRGYGCMRREDALAEIACVSHTERVDGIATREIRLHFRSGLLQQFSITAERQHFDAILAALRARHGDPQPPAPAGRGGYPSWRWQNGESRIAAHRGRDLVFVAFALTGEAAAPERPRAAEPDRVCR